MFLHSPVLIGSFNTNCTLRYIFKPIPHFLNTRTRSVVIVAARTDDNGPVLLLSLSFFFFFFPFLFFTNHVRNRNRWPSEIQPAMDRNYAYYGIPTWVVEHRSTGRFAVVAGVVNSGQCTNHSRASSSLMGTKQGCIIYTIYSMIVGHFWLNIYRIDYSRSREGITHESRTYKDPTGTGIPSFSLNFFFSLMNSNLNLNWSWNWNYFLNFVYFFLYMVNNFSLCEFFARGVNLRVVKKYFFSLCNFYWIYYISIRCKFLLDCIYESRHSVFFLFCL